MNAEASHPVKRERSSSPVLKEPVTSGAKWYPSVPFECTKKSHCWFEARQKWIKDETTKLSEKGLTVKRAHFRDDGLVLDWESATLVWPDTLLPAETAERHQDGAQQAPIDAAGADIDMELSKIEDMAVEYLRLYTKAFDTDRSTLVNAYSSDACFSYCVHDVVSLNTLAANFTQAGMVQHFASRKGARNLLKLPREQWGANLHKGPAAIISALTALGPHKFCARSPTDVNYSVLAVYLGSDPYVFMICSGHLTEERGKRENRLSFDQSFVLRLPDLPKSDSPKSTWPLVAACHQLTVRE